MLTACLLVFVCTGCQQDVPAITETPSTKTTIKIDGSSTVYPICKGLADRFQQSHPQISIDIAVSGTGGGFKRFCNGETAINNASRRIKSSEAEQAATAGVSYLELPLALDGITVTVSSSNTFVDHLTTAELQRLWTAGSTITNWSDLRPDWPDRPIKLVAPGSDSGTHDFFLSAILGKGGQCRQDCLFSEDDNVLVRAVAENPDSIGFFGMAYYFNNRDSLRGIPIDAGDGPVAPTRATVADSSYRPLSRPLFWYVNTTALQQEQTVAFIRYGLEHVTSITSEVGYIQLAAERIDEAKRILDEALIE